MADLLSYSSSGVSWFCLGFYFSINIQNQLIVLLKFCAILIWNLADAICLPNGPYTSILRGFVCRMDYEREYCLILLKLSIWGWVWFLHIPSSPDLVTRSCVRDRRESESLRMGWEEWFYCLGRQFFIGFLYFCTFTSKGSDCLSGLSFQECLYNKQHWRIEIVSHCCKGQTGYSLV